MGTAAAEKLKGPSRVFPFGFFVMFILAVILATVATAGAAEGSLDTLDTGDTAWVLVSSALVLIMIPGLAFFYGGLVRKKNMLSVLMQCFALMSLITLQWVFIGYSLSFGPDVGYTLIDQGAIRGMSKIFRGWFFVLAFTSIGLATNFRELGHYFKGGKPLILYICGQSLNLILTLLMAYIMFYKVFPEITAKI